jgi:copper(I)-binding protein
MIVKRYTAIPVAAFLLLLTLLVGGACGDDDIEEEDTSTAAPTTQEATATAAATEPGVTTLGDLSISGPFARGALDRGAVFFTVTNTGEEDDALIGATSDVAATVELHETVMEGGSTMMRPVERIVVPAGGNAVLEPGGLHVMLTDPEDDIEMGDTVRVALEFEHAGSVEIEAMVTSYNASPMPMEGSPAPMQ